MYDPSKDVGMQNEILAKIVCHNISCVISAMFELGIQANFGFQKLETIQ